MAITLPEKFETELEKIEREPSILLYLTEGFLSNTQTSEGDWTANSSESNVDYATIKGSVILDTIATPDFSQLTTDANIVIHAGPTGSNPLWQSFQQTSGNSHKLNTVSIYAGSSGSNGTLVCEIWDAAKGTQYGSTLTRNIPYPGVSAVDFDFTADDITIATATTYYIKLYGSGTNWTVVTYNTAGGYAGGQLNDTLGYIVGAGNDTKFAVTFKTPYYQASGTIETQNMTLDSTPAVDGEWIIYDQENDETITYNAEGSATGAWGGEEVNLGAIVDGQAITGTKYKYYRVTASLSTADVYTTPELQEITVSFETRLKLSDNDALGYEPSIKTVSSLTTKIGDFENTTVGQLTVKLARTTAVETYFLSGSIYPKNKPAVLKFGFIVDNFEGGDFDLNMTEAEYMTFFTGVIDNYRVDASDWITVTIKDAITQLDVEIPVSTAAGGPPTAPTTTPKVYTALHPIAVMEDILQTQVNIRDSQIDLQSFTDAETSLGVGWLVSRTLNAEQENAKEMLEELRKLMNCYLIPKPDGKISIKEWDAAEAQADAWTDADYMVISWDRNSKELVNQVSVYFDWQDYADLTPQEDDYADFNNLIIDVDSTSVANYGETKERIRKDKWTRAAQSANVDTYTAALIARYKNPPGIIDVKMDMKKLKYEVGDIIDITSARPIGSGLGGLTNEHFQIINKNLDFQRGTLTFKLLQVAGD